MTAVVKVAEADATLPDLLAQVEAGKQVVIERRDVPIARLIGVPPQRDAAAIIAGIQDSRAGRSPTSPADILAWRDEGRRF